MVSHLYVCRSLCEYGPAFTKVNFPIEEFSTRGEGEKKAAQLTNPKTNSIPWLSLGKAFHLVPVNSIPHEESSVFKAVKSFFFFFQQYGWRENILIFRERNNEMTYYYSLKRVKFN